MKLRPYLLLVILISSAAWGDNFPYAPVPDDSTAPLFERERDTPQQRQTRKEIADSLEKVVMDLYPQALLDTTNWRTYCELYRTNRLPEQELLFGYMRHNASEETASLQVLVECLRDPLVQFVKASPSDSSQMKSPGDKPKLVPSSAEWVVDSLGYLIITSLADSLDAVVFDSLFDILAASRGMIVDIRWLRNVREEYVIEAASAFLPVSADSVGIRKRLAGTDTYKDKLVPVKANQTITYTKPVIIIDHGNKADWPRRLIRLLLESRKKYGDVVSGDYHYKGLRGIEPVRVTLPRGLVIELPTATALSPTRQPYFDEYSDLHSVGTNCKAVMWPLAYPKSVDVSEAIWMLRKRLSEE